MTSPGLDTGDAALAMCGVPRLDSDLVVRLGVAHEFEPPSRPRALDAEAAAAELRTHLADVLARPDVSGADVALSGGLDSAALVGLVVARGGRPTAWTLDDGFADEVAHAARLASRFALTQRVVEVDTGELPDHFAAAVRGCGSLLWNARAVAKHVFWQRAAAAGGRQVMVGAGADELFADPVPGLSPLLLTRRAQHEVASALLHTPWRSRVTAVAAWLGLDEDLRPGLDPRNGLLASLACAETLPPEVRAGAAAGVSVCLPYLDPHLRAFALALPIGLLTQHGTDKWLLREAWRGVLPDDVRMRPKQPRVAAPRGGQAVSRRWSELLATWVAPRPLAAIACIDAHAAVRLRDRHAAMRPGDPDLPAVDAALMRLASLSVLCAEADA